MYLFQLHTWRILLYAGVLLQSATDRSAAARRRPLETVSNSVATSVDDERRGEGARRRSRRVGGRRALRDAARRLALAASRRDRGSVGPSVSQLFAPATETYDRYLIAPFRFFEQFLLLNTVFYSVIKYIRTVNKVRTKKVEDRHYCTSVQY